MSVLWEKVNDISLHSYFKVDMLNKPALCTLHSYAQRLNTCICSMRPPPLPPCLLAPREIQY